MSGYLLDTHTLLWSLSNPEELDREARNIIQHPQHRIFVSAATIWEMAIKTALGKLKTPSDLEEQLKLNRFEILNVTFLHAQAIANLPLLHRNPFDRMLVSQAQNEVMTLITRDPFIQQYDISWIVA